jgi:hypothetical protein
MYNGRALMERPAKPDVTLPGLRQRETAQPAVSAANARVDPYATPAQKERESPAPGQEAKRKPGRPRKVIT